MQNDKRRIEIKLMLRWRIVFVIAMSLAIAGFFISYEIIVLTIPFPLNLIPMLSLYATFFGSTIAWHYTRKRNVLANDHSWEDAIASLTEELKQTVNAQNSVLVKTANDQRSALVKLDEQIIDSRQRISGEIEVALEEIQQAVDDKISNLGQRVIEERERRKAGRKRGTLSSGILTAGTTIDEMLPFLKEAQRARDLRDGSFTRLCREKELPESTVRDWLTRYADLIPRE